MHILHGIHCLCARIKLGVRYYIPMHAQRHGIELLKSFDPSFLTDVGLHKKKGPCDSEFLNLLTFFCLDLNCVFFRRSQPPVCLAHDDCSRSPEVRHDSSHARYARKEPSVLASLLMFVVTVWLCSHRKWELRVERDFVVTGCDQYSHIVMSATYCFRQHMVTLQSQEVNN